MPHTVLSRGEESELRTLVVRTVRAGALDVRSTMVSSIFLPVATVIFVSTFLLLG